jgi:hypothetical protein
MWAGKAGGNLGRTSRHVNKNSIDMELEGRSRFYTRPLACFTKQMRNTLLTASLAILALLGSGCGATCDRIEKDHKKFLERVAVNEDTHIEVTIPFATADDLISRQVSKMKSMDIDVPGMGNLGSYFGKLSIKPRRVKLRAARENHVGLHLEFDVRESGKKVFSMSVDTEIKPKIDLEKGVVVIGFGPKDLKSVKPRMSKGAKKDLGGLIYKKVPRAARMFVPRKLVDKAAGSVVSFLVSSFYKTFKDKLLPKMGDLSRFELQLPDVPVRKLTIRSFGKADGGLRLLIVTDLPVRKGIVPDDKNPTVLPDGLIAVRTSGSTLAQTANWAMAKGLVPDRYDKKGKPRKNGELRPGLDWIPGKRPMKIYLWDLDKPCMRVDMGANAKVSVKGDKVEIKATGAKVENVDASAFTKAGVWFYALWKDAIKMSKKASSEMKFKVAGQKMVSKVVMAELADDELTVGLSLVAEK